MENQKLMKLLATAGLIVGPLYFLLMGVLGGMWEGYSWVSQHMSELGGVESPYKNIMNVFGFMGSGMMIMLFGFGLYLSFKKNMSLKLASVCICLAGIFMIIVGFFPCDAHCVDVTLIGRLHTITSIPQSILLPLGVIVAGVGFRKEKGWGRKWQIISAGLGWGSMAVGPIMSTPQAYAMIGLVQRLGIGLSLTWVTMVSGRLLFFRER